MGEKCPCQIYVKSCCACVSMHCDECHGHSKFVQGRFCSNCGRPLKGDVDWHREAELNAQRIIELEAELSKVKTELVGKLLQALKIEGIDENGEALISVADLRKALSIAQTNE